MSQGKGKKKGNQVTKLSLDEFNQIDAPHGHSVVSLKVTGLDWAETMADYDQQSAETQQIIVPAAPRAQRGPTVQYDTLPTEPPFRVSLLNVPMSVEEKELTDRFFAGIDIKRVDIQKSSTTLELASRDAMYEALCKDGSTMKNRTITVCIYGEEPRNNYGSDRYGGRGSNSSYGDRSYQSSGGFGGQNRGGGGYGDRSGFNRDRDNYTGYNRGGIGAGGFGQRVSGGGFGDRYTDNRNNYRDNNRGQYTSGGGEPQSEEPENWRSPKPSTVKQIPPPPQTSYNNGSRQTYMHSRPEQQTHQHQIAPPHHHQQQSEPYYQPRYQQHHHHHNQPPNNSPYSQFDNQAHNRPAPPSATGPPAPEERPKLVIHKRKTPLNIDDVSSVTRNEAIFGKAKPSSTPYQKMNEVEEKLKAVQIADPKDSKPTSQAGSQPGSAPRSRRVSSNHSESNS